MCYTVHFIDCMISQAHVVLFGVSICFTYTFNWINILIHFLLQFNIVIVLCERKRSLFVSLFVSLYVKLIHSMLDAVFMGCEMIRYSFLFFRWQRCDSVFYFRDDCQHHCNWICWPFHLFLISPWRDLIKYCAQKFTDIVSIHVYKLVHICCIKFYKLFSWHLSLFTLSHFMRCRSNHSRIYYTFTLWIKKKSISFLSVQWPLLGSWKSIRIR